MMVTYPALRVLREFLTCREPICGAEIMRSLNGEVGPGTIYPMLARLSAEGWIVLMDKLPDPNGPTAFFYSMTPAGKAAFLDMLVRLTIPSDLWRTPDA